ncbi:liporotein ABC transporter permease [Pseudomonas fragi]|uniref:Liporotein ABC transporter permease n=1 Tax=Pseudomonas fragi TaxID=296 RepID=A0A449IFZ2_PSEFR|nr:liporotein ABC transporter permease [Pseudomonas fragi]
MRLPELCPPAGASDGAHNWSETRWDGLAVGLPSATQALIGPVLNKVPGTPDAQLTLQSGHPVERHWHTVPHATIVGVKPIDDWRPVAEAAMKNPEVTAAVPFTELDGMLSYKGSMQPIQISGIDPEQEGKVSIVTQHIEAAEIGTNAFEQCLERVRVAHIAGHEHRLCRSRPRQHLGGCPATYDHPCPGLQKAAGDSGADAFGAPVTSTTLAL